jgi:hypothetical protein
LVNFAGGTNDQGRLSEIPKDEEMPEGEVPF